MKHFLIAVAITATAITIPAFAADAEVSVKVGQPGLYGRLDIDGYRQPRVIESLPMSRPPIYLRVPLRQSKHWGGQCRELSANNERTFFARTTACTFRAARNKMVIAVMTAAARAQG